MENSAILSFLVRSYEKLCLYYSHSGLNKLAGRMSEGFKRLCQGSSIGHFFSIKWKTDTAWKNSHTITVFLFPVRLLRLISSRISGLFKNHAEGSALVNGTLKFLDSILTTSTSIYGLFLLAFTATEGVLWLLLKPFMVKLLLLRLALLAIAVLFILIDRPVKALFNGSFVGKLIADFFVVRGIENETYDK